MRGFGDYVADDVGGTLKARDYRDSTDLVVVNGRQDPVVSSVAQTLGCQHNGMDNVVSYDRGVRRLTPVECERLQGMPDNHTRIPWRGKSAEDCPDGPRYKAIGNSMAVPVMRWIGERIQAMAEIKAAGEVAA